MSDEKKDLYLQAFDRLEQKLGKNTEALISLDKKVDLHIQKTEFELQAIHEQDLRQNDLLQEHHDRSVQLKRDNDLRESNLRKDMGVIDKRVTKLEEPRKWLKQSWGIILVVFAILGAMESVSRILEVALPLLHK